MGGEVGGEEVGDSSSDLVTSCWNAQLVYKMLESEVTCVIGGAEERWVTRRY